MAISNMAGDKIQMFKEYSPGDRVLYFFSMFMFLLTIF